METLKRKNDFSCTAFQGSLKKNFMKYVHNIESYKQWLDKQNITWSVINIYNRRTHQFIQRIYK